MEAKASPLAEAAKPEWSTFEDGIFSAYSSASAFDAVANAKPQWPRAEGHHHDHSGPHSDIHGDSGGPGPRHYDDHTDIKTG